ncbi:hypothetical protein OUZ56_011883 [Daphnia magna]|uniref:Uncharacterized protein n=1 Tax=Daphnia magna TaxID=35525 RepID=A0ABQ9Z1Q7_9CRUS|nr:hypothetical protein OUZ56_011883 [Daphnia magna]
MVEMLLRFSLISGSFGDRISRRPAGEAAREIQNCYSGLRPVTPLGAAVKPSTGLQLANAASALSKGRSRGPPGEVSEPTLGKKGTWSTREVSLPREVPDPSQVQTDFEPQTEEFEDAQSKQDSRNSEARRAVIEEAFD